MAYRGRNGCGLFHWQVWRVWFAELEFDGFCQQKIHRNKNEFSIKVKASEFALLGKAALDFPEMNRCGWSLPSRYILKPEPTTHPRMLTLRRLYSNEHQWNSTIDDKIIFNYNGPVKQIENRERNSNWFIDWSDQTFLLQKWQCVKPGKPRPTFTIKVLKLTGLHSEWLCFPACRWNSEREISSNI